MCAMVTNPRDIASAGVIATLRSMAWTGDAESPMSTSGKRVLMPGPYRDKINSVMHERRTIFRRYRMETVFGSFMTVNSVFMWRAAEEPIVASLQEAYTDMAADTGHILDHATAVGGEMARHEWNLRYPGTGSPTKAFQAHIEEKFRKMIPQADRMSSAAFWTEYHIPPPASLFPPEVASAQEHVMGRLSAMFASQVVAGLRGLLLETCSHAAGMAKKSGETDKRDIKRMSRLSESLYSMWFFGDDNVRGLIKCLYDEAGVCYKDVGKVKSVAGELKNVALAALDEMVVET